MNSRRAFVKALTALTLAGCGGGGGGSAPNALPTVTPTATPTPGASGTPTPAPTATPTSSPTTQPGSIVTQWGIQMDLGDNLTLSLPLLQQLRPAWIHVLYDPNYVAQFVALAQTLGCGLFLITNSDVNAITQCAKQYASVKIAWDILNEPDIFLTQPAVAPIDYVTLATAMASGIKSVAPNHLVCVASCSGLQSADPQWYELAFTDGLLQTKADAVGFHPYGGGGGANGGPPFTAIALSYQALIARYGGKQQLWNTEWGQASGTTAQAPQMISWAGSLQGYVQMAIWLSFRDAGTDGSRESSFGLVDYNYNPKAVFPTAVSIFGS